MANKGTATNNVKKSRHTCFITNLSGNNYAYSSAMRRMRVLRRWRSQWRISVVTSDRVDRADSSQSDGRWLEDEAGR